MFPGQLVLCFSICSLYPFHFCQGAKAHSLGQEGVVHQSARCPANSWPVMGALMHHLPFLPPPFPPAQHQMLSARSCLGYLRSGALISPSSCPWFDFFLFFLSLLATPCDLGQLNSGALIVRVLSPIHRTAMEFSGLTSCEHHVLF